MTAIWLLMGLLLLAYVGSFLFGGHAIRGIGLASGVEYVVLGFLVGPEALGILERSTLASFDPLAHVALGWLMLVVGVTYGRTQTRAVRAGRLLGGAFVALLTAAMVAGAVWLVLWRAHLSVNDRLLVAGGVGAVCAETTRYAVRWVVERHRAAGPVSELIDELAQVDHVVPVLGLAGLFALAPSGFAIHVPRLGVVGITLGVGVVLGALAAALLGRTFRIAETWGALLGMSLLAVGISARLGASTISTMFMLGLTLALFSPHRRELAALLSPTERPVMLPALVLAGAHVDLAAAPYLPFVVAAAVLARVLGKLLAGLGVLAFSRPARRSGVRLGFGLLSAGALSIAIGLAYVLRFPGPVGDVVLAAAALVTIFGEFVGPASLRWALVRAGEVPDDAAAKSQEAPA